MVDCEECGKRLSILQGYRHPALGIKFLVCGKCFDKIDEDMKRWSQSCLVDSSNAEPSPSMINLQSAWDKNYQTILCCKNGVSNLWIKIGSPLLAE